METQVMQPFQKRHLQSYFDHIANHPQTKDFYLLHDHDAIAFLLDMGKIELAGAPFSSGKELLDFVLNNRHLDTPQILFPHKSVVVFFALADQRPMVVVSTTALRIKVALPDLLSAIAPETADTLEQLIRARGEATLDNEADEDPADAVVVFRPDLIPLSDCYQDLRKLGYKGIVMIPGLIRIPYEHWKGGVHYEVTPVKDDGVDGFYDFESEVLWANVCYYVPKQYLSM
jgi:hypothetical protein